MRKGKTIEIIAVVVCMVFATAISLFHISDKSDFGLSNAAWNTIWVLSENGLMMSLCFLIGYEIKGVIRCIFWYLWIPYFLLKIIYHIVCYNGVYFMPYDSWNTLWTIELELFPLAVMICVVIYVYTEKIR